MVTSRLDWRIIKQSLYNFYGPKVADRDHDFPYKTDIFLANQIYVETFLAAGQSNTVFHIQFIFIHFHQSWYRNVPNKIGIL